MKKAVLIIAFAFMAAISYSQTCGSPTKSGTPCRRHVAKEGMKCYQHGGSEAKAAMAGTPARSKSDSTSASVQCSGITKSGNRCKNKTKDGSGYCRLHKNQK